MYLDLMSFQVLDCKLKDLKEEEWVKRLNVSADVYESMMKRFVDMTGKTVNLSLAGSTIALPRDPKERPLCIIETFIMALRYLTKAMEIQISNDSNFEYTTALIKMNNIIRGSPNIVTIYLKDLELFSDDKLMKDRDESEWFIMKVPVA